MIKPHKKGELLNKRYLIEDTISVGAYGALYKSTLIESPFSSGLGKPSYFAVKQVPITKSSIEPVRKQLEAFKLIKHKNVNTLLEYFESDRFLYMVYSWIADGDLTSLLNARKGKLENNLVQHIFRQIIEGYNALITADIAHRNIKTTNILILYESEEAREKNLPTVRLSEMGLVRIKEECGKGLNGYCATSTKLFINKSKRTHFVGSFPPFHTAGVSAYNLSIDAWALGVVLYYLLTGTYLFSESLNLDEVPSNFGELMERGDYSIRGEPDIFAIDLLSSFLQYNPENRAKLKKVYLHPYIRGDTHKWKIGDLSQVKCSDGKGGVYYKLNIKLRYRLIEEIDEKDSLFGLKGVKKADAGDQETVSLDQAIKLKDYEGREAEAIEILKVILSKKRASNKMRGIAECKIMGWIALFYAYSSQIIECKSYLVLLEEFHKNSRKEARTCQAEHEKLGLIIGRAYGVIGEKEKSKKYLQEGLGSLAILQVEDDEVGAAMNSLGVLQRHAGDLPAAMQTHTKARDIYLKKLQVDNSTLALIYKNLAVEHHLLKDLDSAIENGLLSVRTYTKLRLENESVAEAFANLATYFRKKQKYLLALQYSTKAVTIYAKYSIQNEGSAQAYKNLARNYVRAEQYQNSIVYGLQAACLYLKLESDYLSQSLHPDLEPDWKLPKNSSGDDIPKASLELGEELSPEGRMAPPIYRALDESRLFCLYKGAETAAAAVEFLHNKKGKEPGNLKPHTQVHLNLHTNIAMGKGNSKGKLMEMAKRICEVTQNCGSSVVVNENGEDLL